MSGSSAGTSVHPAHPRRSVYVPRMATRNRSVTLVLLAVFVLALGAASCSDDGTDSAAQGTGETTSSAAPTSESDCVDSAATATDPEAADIVDAAQSMLDEQDLRAVVLRVQRGDEDVVTTALGESLDGVEASPDMHFWNGAALFSLLGNAMLQLNDEGALDIDAPLAEVRRDAPAADQITPRMLMTSMSGYADYESQDDWVDALYENPFRAFTQEELEGYVFSQPLVFEPGTNVGYSHLNFRLAGEVVADAAGKPLEEVLTERILEPFDMSSTVILETADIPQPLLHTFSDERGQYEETTGWSPAWGVPEGAAMATTICDLARGGRAVGSGELISEEAYEVYVNPGTADVGERTDECPSCIPQTEELHFGLGVVVMGDWLVQTPLFTGIAGLQAYLPSEDITVAVANTFGMGSDVGTNYSTQLFRDIAAIMAPDATLPDLG